MSETTPFRRIARPFVNYSDNWTGIGPIEKSYIRHDGFKAPDRLSLIRSFRLLNDDLARLFEFIEPDGRNSEAFSHRSYELLLRACTEVESHSKAILRANSLPEPTSRPYWNQTNYQQLDGAMLLSAYEVRLPIWTPDPSANASQAANALRTGFAPFKDWARSAPGWWGAYNEVKHDRSKNLPEASLIHTVEAVAAVAILLAAQFGPGCHTEVSDSFGAFFTSDDGYVTVAPNFEIRPPNWPQVDQYDFDLAVWGQQSRLFQDFPFT